MSAVLEGLSFKEFFKSTAKPVNVLNTRFENNRQTTDALPPTLSSVDIPDLIHRRDRNRRIATRGPINPLYNLSVINDIHPVATSHLTLVATSREPDQNHQQETDVNSQMPTRDSSMESSSSTRAEGCMTESPAVTYTEHFSNISMSDVNQTIGSTAENNNNILLINNNTQSSEC